MTSLSDVLEFGRLALDVRRRVLLIDGREVALQSRQFDILELLVAERDRVVGRDEIVSHVWRGLTVAENNLAVQMSSLRRALAEHGADKVILTVPGRGYRFVGEAAERRGSGLPDEPHPVPSPAKPAGAGPAPAIRASRLRAWRRAGFAASMLLLTGLSGWVASTRRPAPPGAPPLSIVVLPFRNLGQDRSQDYMADAVSDDLTTDLAHIPGSLVIARESAEVFRARPTPSAEIGRALNVRYLVAGSLLEEAGSFHINAQLIEAATGSHLWAERFDTPIRQMAEARSAIVRRLASGLDVKLTDIESERSFRDRPDDPDALGLFYRARSLAERDDSPDGLATAQSLLEQATANSPAFSEAHALLGLVLLHRITKTDDPDNERDLLEARRVIGRVMSLTPRSPAALAAEAQLNVIDRKCDAASASANAALQEEPNSREALAVLAKCAFVAGDLEAAASYEQTMLKLNPEGYTNKLGYAQLALIRLIDGSYAEALSLVRRSLVGDAGSPSGKDNMGRVEYCKLMEIAALQLNGDAEGARGLYSLYSDAWPSRSVWRVGSHSPAGVTRLPGFARFLGALQEAGMPRFEDEAEDFRVPSPSSPQPSSAFGPTPLTIPGAQRITTIELAQLLRGDPPTVIDVGPGVAVARGAVWRGDAAAQSYRDHFVAQVLMERVHGFDDPVVIMGAGIQGFTSYNAALQAVSLGYRRVLWYRGGEEAWAAAGMAADDRRRL